jgi:hypothetical protein
MELGVRAKKRYFEEKKGYIFLKRVLSSVYRSEKTSDRQRCGIFPLPIDFCGHQDRTRLFEDM